MAVEITRDLELAAPPAAVGELLVDLPRWPEWFALHKGWIGDPPPRAEPGARFGHRVRILGVPGEIEWTVTTLEFPRRFALRGKGSSRTNAEIDFRVAPEGDASRIAFTARLGGLAVRPFEGMLRPWLEVRAERTVSALREQLADGRHAATRG